MTEQQTLPEKEERGFVSNLIRKVIALFAGMLLAAFMLLSALAITLNIKPLDITDYLHYFQKHLKVGENSIYIQKAEASYKGSLRFRLEGVTVRTPENVSLSAASSIDVALSNRNLALGRIVVKHAQVSGMNLQVNMGKDGFEIASLQVKKTKEGEPRQDIVTLLQNEKTIPTLKYLKTVEITDSNLQITDETYGDIWSVSHIQGILEKSITRGVVLDLDVDIQRVGEDFSMPAGVSFSYFPGSDYADMYLEVSNAHAGILAKYLPLEVQNLLSGNGTVRLGTSLLAGHGISSPYFQVDLTNGSFVIEGIYNFPLPFETLHVKGSYSQKGNHRLDIETLEMKDDKGYVLTGKGVIDDILGDPDLDLFLASKSMPLRHLLRYLPDGKIGGTTSWINRNIHQAEGENIRLVYKGPASKFPCRATECVGFDGSFDFKDLNLRFMDEMAPVTGVAGHFILRDGEIIIQAPKGKISNQDVTDVTVSISDLFEDGKEKMLTAITKVSGNTQGVLDRIGDKVGKDWFPGTVKGTHVSHVKVTLPLKNEIGFKDVDFNVTSKLINSYYDVPVGSHKLPFQSEQGTLNISDHKLTIKANGTISGVPVAAVWKENLLAAGDETTIALDGHIQAEKLNTLARSVVPIESIGSTPFNLLLSKIEKDIYDYELSANFKDTSLIVPLLNWEKVSSSPLDLKARGRTEINGKLFAIDNLAVSGEGVEIAGGLYLDDKGKTTLTLSPFKLGKTNITALMSGKKILFEGPSLDISGLDILKEDQAAGEETPRDISFDAKFDLLTMSGGTIHNAELVGDRESGKWQKFVFSGLTHTGSSVEVNLQPEATRGNRVLKARATNAGEALKTLGLYDKLSEGMLTLTSYLDKGDGSQSDGELKITRTKIKDMPILAKLLSLLSLEQLLSGGDGIIFDDVTFPFEMTDEKITINKAKLEGPSIGMRFSGDILRGTNNLDIKGSLIPIQGLNKVVSNLPIVGNILTGSQDGLLVADFKIKGSYDKPDIKTNPLSAVTPGLLKDIFGAFSGDDKK